MPVLFPSNRHSVPQLFGVVRRWQVSQLEDVVAKPDVEIFSEGCNLSVNVQDISTIQAESRYRITLPFIDADVFSLT